VVRARAIAPLPPLLMLSPADLACLPAIAN
jgi:hypothetical protein